MQSIDWKQVESALASPFASEVFKYKGHKISVQRQYESESKTKLSVYIDDYIKGAWIVIPYGNDSEKEQAKLKERPDVIDDVWMLKTQSKFTKRHIESMIKIFGKRRAIKENPELYGKISYRWPYFNKSSSVVRQFKKLEGIEWVREEY